jgi:hypothetical protein
VQQKFALLKTAYNPGVAEYLYNGNTYCAKCAGDVTRIPDGPFYSVRDDVPHHCAKCGRFLENELTQEGYSGLRTAAQEGEILQEWRDFYPEAFEGGGMEKESMLGHDFYNGIRPDDDYAPDTGRPMHEADTTELYQPRLASKFDEHDLGLQDRNVRLWVVREVDHEPTIDEVAAFVATQTLKRPTKRQLWTMWESASAAWDWKKKSAPEAAKTGAKSPYEATGRCFCESRECPNHKGRSCKNPATGRRTPAGERQFLCDNCLNYAAMTKQGAGLAKKRTSPNTVVREVCNDDGRRLGMLSGQYDGTPEDMVRVAQLVTDQMFDEYGADCSNMESGIVATDESGVPKWKISPNFRHVEEIMRKQAQGAGNTTVTMQEQNVTDPNSPGGKEPMAVAPAIDQTAGPHSPNAPATAPRTPDVVPKIVDVPAGTANEESGVLASKQASLDVVFRNERGFVTDFGARQEMISLEGSVGSLPRYGVWQANPGVKGGYPQVTKTTDDLDEVKEFLGEPAARDEMLERELGQQKLRKDVLEGEGDMEKEGAGYKDEALPVESTPELDDAIENEKADAEEKTAAGKTYEVFVRDWWRVERGRLVPNPGADEEQLGAGLSYEEAREMCDEYNSTHDPGEVSRKAEFRVDGETSEEGSDEPGEGYTIYGRYRGKTEEIDTADDLSSAEHLVGEYKLAYGNEWEIWYEDAQGNRGDMPAAPGKRDLDMMRSMGIRGSKEAAGAPPVVSPNVVQNQSLMKPGQQQMQPSTSVALMPGGQEDGNAPERRTIQPELAQAEFLMRESSLYSTAGADDLLAAEEARLASEEDVN